QRGEFLPPRSVKEDVPPGLDAVCRKAMALRPQDRYASAQSLADDLGRWLADEQVAAWREPWGERVRRLSRKDAGFAAGLTLALTLVGVLVAILARYQLSSWAKGRRQPEPPQVLVQQAAELRKAVRGMELQAKRERREREKAAQIKERLLRLGGACA